jgi:hypothetical protein
MRYRFGSWDRGGTSNETRLATGGLSEGGGGLAGTVWLLSRAGDAGAADAGPSISIGSIIALLESTCRETFNLISNQVEVEVE